MTVTIAKQVGFVEGYRASTQIAKQVGYAQLVYPKIDIAKIVDYAALNRAGAQVGKMVVYALLRETPAEVEADAADFAFTASGFLSLSYEVEPELQIFASLAFEGSGRLAIAYERVPPFLCEPDSETTWIAATPGVSGFAPVTGSTTSWVCADEVVIPSGNDLLVDVAGNYLTYVNGDRIKLI